MLLCRASRFHVFARSPIASMMTDNTSTAASAMNPPALPYFTNAS